MIALRRLIEAVAPTDATVLITGESGTGKELVAREIHQCSRRACGGYVPVNMAALPSNLAESMLFGHEKGAFTGAFRTQKGLCELAEKGTLFLDEIGELELALQAKLLRFLQEQEFQRVGSGESLSADCRIVAATNRDPAGLVEEGRMRADLFFRLNVIPLHVPALRKRREDIPPLAEWFLRAAAERHHKTATSFCPSVLDELCAYDWPGNVRQLENLVHRMVVLSRGSLITMDDLPSELHFARARHAVPSTDSTSYNEVHLTTMERLEKNAIEAALERCCGNVTAAARDLGLGPATVYRKIKRYQIPGRGRRTGEPAGALAVDRRQEPSLQAAVVQRAVASHCRDVV